jgi:competence protein ComEC
MQPAGMNAHPAQSVAPLAPYQPLVVVLAAVCGGIAVNHAVPLSLAWWWPAALGSWIAWWLVWRADRLRVAALLLLMSIAGTAAAWHHCRWSLFENDHIGRFAPETPGPAALEVRAIGGPRHIAAPPPDALRTIVTPERTRLEVEALAVRDGDTWLPMSGLATLFVDGHLLNVAPGDRLRVFAQMSTTGRPHNPGEFDFARFARVDRRLCVLRSEFPECVTRVSRGSLWSWSRAIDWLRASGDAQLWRTLAPSRSGLASAMFLGSREELDSDQAQAFLETGTIHLLVISDLNVAILASCLFMAMRLALVPRGWALVIVAAASVLYAATTDAQPPVVRATVMVLVSCLAMMLGRRSLQFNSIAAAGLVVLAINPAELFQPGTQLSFMSVAVLAWFAQERAERRLGDPLDKLIARNRPAVEQRVRQVGAEVGRLVLVSLAIWLAVCPLVMARFHLLSPVAVLLGPLLSIPVALAMEAGFGIYILGWIAPPLAGLLGWVCDQNLMLMESCVDASRHWRGNLFWVSGPGDWWLAGFYGALACWVVAPRLAPPRRYCVGLLAGCTAVGLAVPLLHHHDAGRLDCTFLSVGHGESVVVELPDGRTLLYDAGRLGSPVSAARTVAGFLWSRGITHLDAVVISHADADHYNALPALIEQFSIGVIYVSPVMFDHPDRATRVMHAAIVQSGVPMREVWGGDLLHGGAGARLEILHPPRRGVLCGDNANSIVLAIEYEGRRVLLTGDLESPGLDDVMAESPLDCDVVLAPHHGSAFSDPPGFADWSTPEWTVVSGGPRDRLDAVATAYESRGAVHVAVAGGQLTIDCWHPPDE